MRERTILPLALLEAATLLSGAGNAAATVLLPWLVLERTGSAGAAGVLAAATAVPLLAASLFSGTVVDRVGRRRTAVVSDLLSATSVAAIPLVDRAWGVELWSLVALAVLGACFDPAGITARETMLPAAARRAGWQLERANGVHEAVWGVAFLIGPGMGGVLIAWIGAADALWVTAVCFVISALAERSLVLPDAGRPPEPESPRDGWWPETRAGLTFVWRDRLLRDLALFAVVIVAVYMPVEGVVLPVLFEQRDQPGRLGAVIMAMSAGGVLGALAYGAVAARVGRRTQVFRAALTLTGVFVMVMAVLPPFPVMLVAAFLVGVAYGPIGPLFNLAMQTRTPESMRGRVVGVLTSADYAAGPFGYLLAGAAVHAFGPEPVFVAIGALVLGTAVLGFALRGIRELDDLPDRVEGTSLDLVHDPLPLSPASSPTFDGPVPSA